MRPKKLTLSAWGPYADEQIVDFDGISDGLFLLTGPTGSGKTMIFDGISYALFGVPSGKIRERDTLRSDFAKETDETFVKLSFEHRGNVYTVIRHPRYTRQKKRGEGEITVNEKACLYMPGGQVIENLTVVNEKISEILGVNHEQFKQIAMIAQGEFQELLTADSKKRVEIFRNIFGTEVYERIQRRLSERAGTLAKEIDALRNRTEEAMASIVSQNHEKLQYLLGQQVVHEAQVADALGEAVAKDRQLLAATDKILKELGEAYNAAELDYKLYIQNKNNEANERAASEKLLAALEKGEQDFLKLQPEYDNLSERQSEIRALQKKLDEDSRLMDIVKAIQGQEKICREAAKKSASAKEERQRQKAALDKLQDTIAQNKEKLSEQQKADEAVALYEGGLKDGQRAAKDCEQLVCLCKDFVGVKKAYAAKTAVYQKAQDEADEKKQRYEGADRIFRQAAAGLLAQKLLEGQPCPVCGSVHHPSPAALVSGIVSEAQLKGLKSESETAVKLADKFLNELTGLQGEKVAHWTNIVRQAKTVLAIEDDRALVGNGGIYETEQLFYKAVQAKKEAIAAKNEEISARLSRAKQQKKQFEALRQKQEDLEKALGEKTALFEKYSEAAANLEIEAQKQKALLENTKQQLPKGLTEAAIIMRRQETEHSLKAAEKAVDAVQKAYNEVLLQLTQDKAKHKEVAAHLEKYEAEAKKCRQSLLKLTGGAEPEAWLSKLRAQMEEKKKDRDFLYRMYHQNSDVYKTLKAKAGKKEALDEAYGRIKKLENAARGNNQRRLEFEQYVLGTYFDEILEAANLRLYHMSEGRYELFRTEKVKDMRRRNSLDIEVLDNYTGRRRPVKTLSGGESFKAALSLALGLSDVIQNYVGGIDIDLLFIDEGFGSLDETSVQTAVDTLMTLAGGSRMVGIISHVSELKERIDTQIIVEKGVCGSRIRKGGQNEF